MTPIVLVYGDRDSLVDIDTMLRQLPGGEKVGKQRGEVGEKVRGTEDANSNGNGKEGGHGSVVVKRLRNYEHLDVLWGRNVHVDVIPVVLEALKRYCTSGNRSESDDVLKAGVGGPGEDVTVSTDA